MIPLLTFQKVGTIAAKRDRFVSGDRKFSGDMYLVGVLSQGPRQRSVKTGRKVSYTGRLYSERRALNAAVRVPSSR